MNILLTGFEAAADELNASRILVESLREEPPAALQTLPATLHYAVLPLSCARLQPALLELWSRCTPQYCVFVGQARGRNRIGFERLASNLLDFTLPDNDGALPRGERIVTDGPAAYWSTLPRQEQLADRLNAEGIPAVCSNHAGNYLCNQLLYLALHLSAQQAPARRCGFIHIPPLPVQAQTHWPETPFMPLAMTRTALTLVLQALAAEA